MEKWLIIMKMAHVIVTKSILVVRVTEVTTIGHHYRRCHKSRLEMLEQRDMNSNTNHSTQLKIGFVLPYEPGFATLLVC